MTFSANLGFLWADRPLPDAIRAAARAGFDAVEFHWPYDTPPEAVRAALDETRLPCLGLNTRRGDTNGLSAMPGRGEEARAAVDEAVAYARTVGAGAVHVMAGFAEGTAADAAFRETLEYACDAAPELTILIEPLNRFDAPGYFLQTTGQAVVLIDALARPNLKLMFDCYHVQITEGDLTRRFAAVRGDVGHVQFAGVPDRGPPDRGEVAYERLLPALEWDGPLGAEYRPGGDTDATLGWMAGFR
ncbi:hydroxypyruvate isomerase family protein [Jannaschia sp. W003]|uniref:hydroxypyruvate isomerase family protein n=1 Tax=Jannaschia sp. W003 TaxID=2867012 RepID=UPI0021A7CEC8|nr:TIM barrel protein [Jannaschia sp. W003]UWQ22980.1 TIM barrel protein [Jannaschia sp. W003]